MIDTRIHDLLTSIAVEGYYNGGDAQIGQIVKEQGFTIEYRVVSTLGLMTSAAALPPTRDREKALKRLAGERLYIDSHRNNSREWRAAQLSALHLEARIVGSWNYERDTP